VRDNGKPKIDPAPERSLRQEVAPVMIRQERCANDNHTRMNVTVRCCRSCGRIVNAAIPIGRCLQERHATALRAGSTYCVNCGDLLAREGPLRRF